MRSVYLEELSAVGAVRFPDIPIYQGSGAPMRLEADLRDCEVTYGEVPKDLNGILYRCGPDRQYPPMGGDDIFIDGEGMVVMFRFDNGHVDFKSRYVHTERFQIAGKASPRPLRPLPQSLHARSYRAEMQSRHRQHQRRLARRQAAGPQRRRHALRAESLHARNRRPLRLRRRDQIRLDVRASASRPDHQRAPDFRVSSQGRRHDRRRVLRHRPRRQIQARSLVQRAVGRDGARLRDLRQVRHLSVLPAAHRCGRAEEGRPVLHLASRPAHRGRDCPALRQSQRKSAGSAAQRVSPAT